ncbi:MAG TPA: pyridoxal phosphate-dependent aminotransferase [Anaerolineales bacterium]|jgi:aspartate/methionine/tyrosine aminotransferase
MFTDRVTSLEAEGAYAVLARAQALESQGRDIIHLELGQPDFSTPENMREAGIKAIRDGHTRYVASAGILRFREIIAEHAGRQRGITIHPEQVVVSPGTKPGLFFPPLALVSPGDEVIYPDPGFPTYSAVVKVTGGVPVPVTLREDNGFSFDLQAFDAAISDRTKLIILNSPSNPTGGVIPRADLEHIAEKALKHNAWVLTDEIYSRLVYDGQEAPYISTIEGMQERTVIVDGFSKSYAMPGWRLGYMIAPTALAERLELLITHSAGCTAAFTQIAGMEALTGPQEVVGQMLAEYQHRRDRVVELVNAIPGVHTLTPRGAFYVFPNIKSFGLSSQVIARRLLDEAGVAVLAGTDFGPGGEGYLRLAYATSMEKIEAGIARMAAFFARLM